METKAMDTPQGDLASQPDGTPPVSDQQQQHLRSPISRSRRSRERSRVTRACDRCKRRKVRCSGTHPCLQCNLDINSCTYKASYTRGRMPPTPMKLDLDQLDEHETRESDSADVTQGDEVSDVAGRDTIQPPEASHQVTSSHVSPEPSQTDLQGHYIGPASGVSFLLRVQKRLHQTVTFSQASSIFTFGDAPLPDPDPASCLLMSRDEGQKLLERYFDFAAATYRFYHRPTVEQWLDEFFTTKGAMRDPEEAFARKAVLFMVFAQAQVYMPGPSSQEDSARYFIAAEQQLAKERGSIRLTSVQARLAQCFYLLGRSRINHCWSLFGTTAHLVLAIGLNRNRRGFATAEFDRVTTECRRRTFWCAYCLDCYLSAALGRPRTFHEDDIDQELPSNIEDSDLGEQVGASKHPRSEQSLMLAPVAHVRLARIISGVLRDLYSIKPISASKRLTLATKHTAALKDWRKEIAYFLDVNGLSASFMKPIYQRQINVLNFAYWHAMILTNRPFLLSNFARLQQAPLSSDAAKKARTSPGVQECLHAAMSIVETVNRLFQADQLFRGYWFTLYFAFSAVVVLYVYAIQQKASPIETYRAYLEAAGTCQGQIFAMAEQGSLTQRYSLVLEELRAEALRHTVGSGSGPKAVSVDQQQPPVTTALDGSGNTAAVPVTSAPSGMQDMSFQELGLILNGDMNWEVSPSSSVADGTGWGHFDSLTQN
ncbi:hypothetical protein PFICI_12511 [Pestalotiopsis fici W106-1]|uniref:Zn(2)-C6 fungal-type domain-containing protein n=1 Tax=Pestalotiopsis fici (strain W106-1 / CGMCC3.15140) TaxID=1229662 RepID=W3WQX1_PESFW|nr:uncharacterized protein PFICI_12511 [Pestalotiopsis fici W106-1]ETS75567.1 hypothetical protein PFICI_12511 [Pestalotiopsis fici W106-1]